VVQRLRKKGYMGANWRGANSWCPHDGARAVAQWLERELPLRIDEIQDAFARDIARRVGWADSMVMWLGGSQGPGVDQIEPGLRWNEFWRRHGDDPKFLRVSEARAVAWERITDERSEDIDAAARATDEAHNDCFRALMSEFKPTLSLSDLPRLRKRGAALRNARTLGPLLARYRTIDTELRVFEETLGDLAIGWDRAVEEESERRRGK
jgi:hypothetical protein